MNKDVTKVARNLSVHVDGEKCHVLDISLIRLNSDGPRWVCLVVSDITGTETRYLVDQANMVRAWVNIKLGRVVIRDMVVCVNNDQWQPVNVEQEKNDGGSYQMVLHIESATGQKRKISVDADGMIKAFHALRVNIEDVQHENFGVIMSMAGIA